MQVVQFYNQLVQIDALPLEEDNVVDALDNQIRNWINNGGNINRILDGINGDTLLHKAAREGRARVIAALVVNGANQEGRNLADQTYLDIVHKRLYAKPEQVQQEPKNVEFKVDCFFEAIRQGNEKAYHFYIERASKAFMMSRDADLRTALHMAAESGHIEWINTLLGIGLSLDAKDKDERTPLFFAAQEGHDAAIKHLLKAGSLKNVQDRYLQTPLHVAAQAGHLEAVKILARSSDGLSLSECLDLRDQSGKRPVDLARILQHAEVVQYLRPLSFT